MCIRVVGSLTIFRVIEMLVCRAYSGGVVLPVFIMNTMGDGIKETDRYSGCCHDEQNHAF